MIQVQGIRLDAFTITEADKDGNRKLHGAYALMASNGKALAKQPINVQYGGGIEVAWSPPTLKALDALLAAIKGDVDAILGTEPV